MALPPESLIFLYGAGAGVGIGGLLFTAAYRGLIRPKLRQAHARADQLEKSARILEESLNQGEEAVLLWPADGGEEVASRQLHEILAIPALIRKVGLIDLLNLFDGSARVELESAVRGLRVNGEEFRLNLPSTRTKRDFTLQGSRLSTDKGAFLADILRIRDETEALGEKTKLSSEARTMGAEAKRLKNLLDSLPIPVWQRAQDLSIVYCNKTYKQAVEGDPTLPGMAKKYEIGAGALGADGRILAQKALNYKRAIHEKHPVVLQGSRKLLEIFESPIAGADPESITGLAGCALDYSTQEEIRKELERQEKAQGELLESLDSAIAIFGTDRRLRFYNTSFSELLKLEATWLNTKPDLGEVMESLRERRLLPEVADFPAFKRSWLDFFTGLLEAKDELLHLPDGRTWRMMVTPHPLGGLVFIFDDVSDRFKLEASHSMLSAVQRETIDNLYEAIAVFSENGKLSLHNPAFAEIWKLSADQLKNEPHISEVLEGTKDYFDGKSGWQEYKQKQIQILNQREEKRGRLERKDGSILDYAIVPLPDGGSLFSYVDITDRARVENALRERAEALETADQLKSEFIANVSYGLRAPLTSIIGFAEILHNNYFGKMNKKQGEYSQGILDAANRLLTLINDILDLASIEAGYMSLQYSSFSVHGMLASVMNFVRDRAASQGLQIHFDCPMEMGTIAADERRLRQVLFNLLSNAMNFTPSGGQITLKGEQKGREIWITVSDTGSGIPPEEQERVFEKFERGNSRKSGAGLGLSLVKSLIELHGGTVDLTSTPGKGTTVICKIPVAPAKSKAA